MSTAAAASGAEEKEVVESPEVHFEPVVKLAPVEVKTHEEQEQELFKMRAKLFRFDFNTENPEWKERGVGDVKFMKHTNSLNIRLIMRRDKTHKICANHFITAEMKLTASAGSDRAWVWTVQADFADEEPKAEQLAIRFKNRESAEKFKAEFERCQGLLQNKDDSFTTDLEKLSVEEKDKPKEEGGEGDEEEGEKGEEASGQEGAKADEGDGEAEKTAASEAAQPQDKDTSNPADPE